MTDATSERPSSPFESTDWLDPLEEQVRQGIRSLIERLVEAELEAVLGRQRNGQMARPLAIVTIGGTGNCSEPSPDHGLAAAGAANPGGWPGAGMEEPGGPGLQAADEAGRGAECRDLSGRHQ